jgi:hypothetical protein
MAKGHRRKIGECVTPHGAAVAAAIFNVRKKAGVKFWFSSKECNVYIHYATMEDRPRVLWGKSAVLETGNYAAESMLKGAPTLDALSLASLDVRLAQEKSQGQCDLLRELVKLVLKYEEG